MMQKTQIALFVSALCLPMVSWAQENVPDGNNSDDVAVLDEIVVLGTSFSQQIGTQKITEEEIARRPSTNGNLTDLLKTNPNVRFSSAANNSNNGGEIAPSEVSFHGAKYYENNYTLDGMSNNDNMDPGSSSRNSAETQPKGSLADDLPAGSTQSFWVDANMIKKIEVFDSNISAEYGNFSGGVVNAELRDPDIEKSYGRAAFRTTSDHFAKFFYDKDSDFGKANQLNFHPIFSKNEYSLELNQPLSENSAILFGYSRKESDIQYYHPLLSLYENGVLGEVGKFANIQRRRAETFNLRGIYFGENNNLWKASIIYAPNMAKFFKRNYVNGGFTNTGGGVQAKLEWEKQFDHFTMKTTFGYKTTGNKVEHESNEAHNYVSAPYIGWSSGSNRANSGGFGIFLTQKDIYTLKQNFISNEFNLSGMQHKLKFGWQVDIAKAKYQRESDSNNYFYSNSYVNPENRSTIQLTNCQGEPLCLAGLQYARNNVQYRAKTVGVRDDIYSAYIEDNIQWHKLNIAAGIRLDHNKFLGKLNIAHRVSGSYDIFGDGKTQIFSGLNRYYSGSILSSKLREDISQYERYTRAINNDGSPAAWTITSTSANSRYYSSKLKNPYSDEITAGFSQTLLASNWIFKWVHRNSKNEFMRKQITNNNYAMTNDGWTKNDTFTVSIKPLKKHQYKYIYIDYSLGYSYSKSKTNSNYYDSEDTTDLRYALYNGSLIQTLNGNIPKDFNNPWQVFVDLNLYFPKIRLNWDHRLSYIAGKKYIYNEGTTYCNIDACGEYRGTEVNNYRDAYQSSHLLLDWRFSYKQPTFKNQYFTFDLDINNVLNRKSVAKSSGGNTNYKMGRNFWFGISYNW